MKTVSEKIQAMMNMLSDKTRALQGPGCSIADLEALQQHQNVTCLPEMYKQLMLTGLIRMLDANVMPEGLMNSRVKEMLLEELEEESLNYPQDLFAFYDHNRGDEIMFFRTTDCAEDPPVYGYRGEGYFDKLADALSDLIFGALEQYSAEHGSRRTAQYGRKLDYYFDSQKGTFYGTPSPSYDEPLPTDKVFEMLAAKLEKIKSRYNRDFQGCTEAELENLKRSQRVACLPATYRELMQLMGKHETSWAFSGAGSSECDELVNEKVKELLVSEFERKAVSYPQDMFVFFVQAKMDFYFFRTRDCDNDPVVFSYSDGFYRIADSFSQYLLHGVDPSEARKHARRRIAYQTEFYFDTERDTFLPSVIV